MTSSSRRLVPSRGPPVDYICIVGSTNNPKIIDFVLEYVLNIHIFLICTITIIIIADVFFFENKDAL